MRNNLQIYSFFSLNFKTNFLILEAQHFKVITIARTV